MTTETKEVEKPNKTPKQETTPPPEPQVFLPADLSKFENDVMKDVITCDYARRIISIHDEVNAGMADVFIRFMNYLEDLNTSPIIIYINSPGGYGLSAIPISDRIKLSSCEVIGVNIGLAASAASSIFLACPRRYSFPSATLLFHRGQFGARRNTPDEVKISIEHRLEEEEKLFKDFLRITGWSLKELFKKIPVDWSVSIDESLKLKLVDGVITKQVKDGFFYKDKDGTIFSHMFTTTPPKP